MTDIKEFLKHQKSHGGDNNLYDHLTNVLGKILLDNPKNAYEVFEHFSHEVKDSNYNFKHPSAFENKSRLRESYQELQPFADKARKLLDKFTTEEGDELGPCGYVPNLMDEFRKFEWAGIHFGENETYLLQRSLTRLAHDTKAKSIRFWGKILAAKNDYWIAEVDNEGATPDGAEPDPDPSIEFFEPRGQGVNQYTYYVSTDVTGEWKLLPIITAKQIIKARKIKRVLTGDLNSDIITNPPFKWKENVYVTLRAQIARISHGTNIIPSGLWKVTTESDEPTEDEIIASREIQEVETDDGKPVDIKFESLIKLDGWCHYQPGILKEGRTIYSDPVEEFDDDAKKEAWELQRKQRDPYDKRLKPISLDKDPNGYKSAWTVKHCGDTTSYDTLTINKAKANFGVAVVKSLVWPGSVTIAFGKKQQSVYVGYGTKASNTPFFPILVQPVHAEPEDAPEQAEPQGQQEEVIASDPQQIDPDS